MKKYLYSHSLVFLILLLLTNYFASILFVPILCFYAIYIVYVYKKSSLIIIIVILITLIINFDYKQINYSNEHTATVVNIYNTSILVREDGITYYLMGIDIELAPGDVITFESNYSEFVDEIGGFDLFYKSTGARAYGWANNIEIVSTKNNLRNNLYWSLLNDGGYFSSNALALLYGKETNQNIYFLDTIRKIGLAHLFVVSGFHISIFYIAIEKVFGKFINRYQIINLISVCSVTFFLYLIYFPLTGIRALFTLIIIRTYRFNKLDSLSIVGLGFFCINPYIMISNSMILSFSITAAIYLLMPGKYSYRDTLTISVISFYLALPTVATWNAEFNLMAPLLNIALTPVITISYIVSLIILPFKHLWIVGDAFFCLFDNLIWLFSHLYIPITINNATLFNQYYLTILTLFYILAMRGHRITLLNTFFAISILLFII